MRNLLFLGEGRSCAGLAGWLLAAGLTVWGFPANAHEDVPADAVTDGLLRRPEFEQVSISPDGNLLAIARRVDGKSIVTLHQRTDLKPLINFDPGHDGEITGLDWIDNERLVISASRLNTAYSLVLREPSVLIVRTDGKDPYEAPGNFFAAIEGDPDHLLLNTCSFAKGGGGCNIPEIRRNDIKHLIKRGELVMAGPKDTTLFADPTGHARFAIGWDDEDFSKTYVVNPGNDGWTLLNDSRETGLDLLPVNVARDGKSGLLQRERKDGPDVVERYVFATGERQEVYADPDSDPLLYLRSLDGKEVVGAMYGATEPKPHFWNLDDPDTRARAEVQAAFPGKIVAVTSTSKDGNRAVLLVRSDREPGAFYLFDRLARKAQLLTRQYPWLDPQAQATQRGFSLKARDGLMLHGLLTVPATPPAAGAPLVVMPHGGPYEITDVWGFDPEVQILAQHGYAVLQVNFRGSGGYGQQFTKRGERQWGRAMQDDVTDATRWALAQPGIDARRVCIYGVSYGAYAALMGTIREPDLYRCAAARSGPFDLAKLYRWGSIHRTETGKEYLHRVLGDDPAELSANSPVNLADRIHVPVLLAHGVLDARVDVRHAELMKKQLARRKQPVELIEYSATGHYLALPSHRADFYTRLLAFLDQYIGANAGATSGTVAAAR